MRVVLSLTMMGFIGSFGMLGMPSLSLLGASWGLRGWVRATIAVASITCMALCWLAFSALVTPMPTRVVTTAHWDLVAATVPPPSALLRLLMFSIVRISVLRTASSCRVAIGGYQIIHPCVTIWGMAMMEHQTHGGP